MNLKNHKINCQCCVCKNLRKEPHNEGCNCLFCKNINNIPHPKDCKCCACRAKRGEYKGKNNFMFNKHPSKLTLDKMKKAYKNHKSDCNCVACKAKRNELSGENHPLFGKHHILKTKKLLSKKAKLRYKIPSNHPFYGRHHTTKARRKMSLAKGGTGVPYENSKYPKNFTLKLKESIRKRDHYTCQYCNITQKEHLIVFGEVLHIHHIDYDKKNCKEDNLITLCNTCNVGANYNRDYWYAYFTYVMDNYIKKGVE
jgi:hypothetical protein